MCSFFQTPNAFSRQRTFSKVAHERDSLYRKVHLIEELVKIKMFLRLGGLGSHPKTSKLPSSHSNSDLCTQNVLIIISSMRDRNLLLTKEIGQLPLTLTSATLNNSHLCVTKFTLQRSKIQTMFQE